MVIIESGWQEAKISPPRHSIFCRFSAWACKAAINSFKINKERIKVVALINLTTMTGRPWLLTSFKGLDSSIKSDNLSHYTDLVLFPEKEQRFLFLWHHPIFQTSFNFSDTVHERANKSIKLFTLKWHEQKLVLRVIIWYHMWRDHKQNPISFPYHFQFFLWICLFVCIDSYRFLVNDSILNPIVCKVNLISLGAAAGSLSEPNVDLLTASEEYLQKCSFQSVLLTDWQFANSLPSALQFIHLLLQPVTISRAASGQILHRVLQGPNASSSLPQLFLKGLKIRFGQILYETFKIVHQISTGFSVLWS